MSADLYFTRVSSSSFFRPLISELAERNSTISGHMVGSKCSLKMHVRNLGYLLPIQIGGPKTTFFERLRNSRPIKRPISSKRNTVYISGQVRWKLHGVSYIVSNQYKLWSTNGFKLKVSFHSRYVNSAFHFIARFRRWRSANGTQPHFAKRWSVIRANNLP